MVAHANTSNARILELTARVSVLEDAWDRVECLSQEMPSQGFMDDLEEDWLDTMMAHDRDYRPILRRVVVSVVTTAPVVELGAIVGPGTRLEGAPP